MPIQVQTCTTKHAFMMYMSVSLIMPLDPYGSFFQIHVHLQFSFVFQEILRFKVTLSPCLALDIRNLNLFEGVPERNS